MPSSVCRHFSCVLVLDTLSLAAVDTSSLWLARGVRAGQNGAVWQRKEFAANHDLARLVRRQAQLWRQDDGVPGL
jgi:hypothetical protein